jgi:hypothetical protein
VQKQFKSAELIDLLIYFSTNLSLFETQPVQQTQSCRKCENLESNTTVVAGVSAVRCCAGLNLNRQNAMSMRTDRFKEQEMR